MTAFVERVLNQFPAAVSRFWIAVDPDDVLLDAAILTQLRQRGFELIEYSDPIAFRLAYEEDFRSRWDQGVDDAAHALLLHFRGEDASTLPADYLAEGRVVSLSLAEFFPHLSYPVLRRLDQAKLGVLFDIEATYASQNFGEQATKDFVLLHLYEIAPQLINGSTKLWSAVLRIHHSDRELPAVLAQHIAAVLTKRPEFERLPIEEIFSSRATMLRLVQQAWERYVAVLGIAGSRIGEGGPSKGWDVDIPFDDPAVYVYVDSLFLGGALHPILAQGVLGNLPVWAKAGVLPDPMALRNLVAQGVDRLSSSVPPVGADHRAWGAWAQQLGEVMSRCHALTSGQAVTLQSDFQALREKVDPVFWAWCEQRLPTLPSVPSAHAPAMLHRTVDFLAARRTAGEKKVALLVFDGLALDQWATIREELLRAGGKFAFDEATTFAWLPTLTSVSRQAIFSGLRPREFADTIDGTAAEKSLWVRAWQDRGLKLPEVVYQKTLQRVEQLPALEELISHPAVKVAGLVVDMVDELIHDAKLGKRAVAQQIREWCATGFVEQIFRLLFQQGFHIYLTSDHGNTEARGVGKPAEGATADVRGERVRIYRSDALRRTTVEAWPAARQLDLPGLPPSVLPLYADHGAAFVAVGEPVVVHGGASIEELVVPFVRVSPVSS